MHFAGCFYCSPSDWSEANIWNGKVFFGTFSLFFMKKVFFQHFSSLDLSSFRSFQATQAQPAPKRASGKGNQQEVLSFVKRTEGALILGSIPTACMVPFLQNGHLHGSNPVSLMIRSIFVSRASASFSFFVFLFLASNGLTAFFCLLPRMP